MARKSRFLNIALAVSGGGYRSMLNAAGVIAALDDRTVNSTEVGHLGGLLQSTSYIAGVSGGSWLVSSLIMNDFQPVTNLVGVNWNFEDPLLEGIPDVDYNSKSQNFNGGEKDDLDLEMLAKRQFNDQYNGTIKERIEAFIYGLQKLSTPGPMRALTSDNESHGGKLSAHKWIKVARFYKSLHSEVQSKRNMGFRVTLTDYWARALSRKLFPRKAHFKNFLSNSFSDIRYRECFKELNVPFPIIVSNLCWPDDLIPRNSTESQIFEFTPYEAGSWDKYLNAFMNIKYIGSAMYDGRPIYHTKNNKSICISGLDNVAFVTAISSSLFNKVLFHVWKMVAAATQRTSNIMSVLLYLFGLGDSVVNSKRFQYHPDLALIAPNPFYGFNKSKAAIELTKSPHLFLVDGGEDAQNIPFHPFLQSARTVDVIIAIDSTSDRANFPDGKSLRATYKRYQAAQINNDFQLIREGQLINYSPFPHVPTADTLAVNKPSFFGCDLKSYPQKTSELDKFSFSTNHRLSVFPPLIVYVPNSIYSFPSNTSTFKLSYNSTELSGMINNGYNTVTMGNSSYFSKCVGCAVLKREFDRIHYGINKNYTKETFEVPEICHNCYEEFCYS